jgi:glutathione peroxidase
MIKKFYFIAILVLLFNNKSMAEYEQLAHTFTFNDLDGSEINLNEYRGKVILVVNVASKCGFTKQYEDLQIIWDKYQSKGLIILGVPSNDFGSQEPGTNDEIKNFCEAKFGITFPVTEKVTVKGDDAHPFYVWAKKNYGRQAIPKWNFHKIIINKKGKVHDTFASITNPTSKRFISSIEEVLD